ncbi:MAG: ParB N-terminal domain-containing protein [Candidatus Thorarchaeota archaeon]|jgi:ParB family chromosome partitioning protein
MESPLVEIDLTQILPDPSQPRKVFDDEAIEALRKDIETNGLKVPLDINPLLDGRTTKYLIIDGECRYHAIEGIIDFGLVPCRLYSYKSQRDIDKHRASTHFHRKDWNPADRAEWLKYYMTTHKLRQQDLAREFSVKQSAVSEWLAPTRDSKVLKALRNDEIGFKQAVLLSRLNDAETRENALRESVGKTKRDTEEIIARAIIEPESDEIQVKDAEVKERFEEPGASQLPQADDHTPSASETPEIPVEEEAVDSASSTVDSETVEGEDRSLPPVSSPSTPAILDRAFEGPPEREAEPEKQAEPEASESEDEPPLETEKKKEPQICIKTQHMKEELQKLVRIPPKSFLARFKTIAHKGNFKNQIDGIHLWSGELSDLMESDLNGKSPFFCETKRKRNALMEILERPKHSVIESERKAFDELMTELKTKIEQDAMSRR